MKSLRMKLFTAISMFVIALSMLIIGVWAVGESQTITMQGSVNFEIADKSLYVKDVRMQEDINSAPYSLKDQDRFMPGFINGNFDMDLGDFTNSYGSFALYFDIINTMDETTNETFAYTVEQPTAPSGATVSVSILDTDGTTLEQIPQGTVKPSQITDSTQITATIKLTVASTSSSSVDLSGITITINQFIPEVYDYFTFDINEDNQTVTLTAYDSSVSDSTNISIPATVDLVDGVWQDGTTYTVTAITDGGSTSGVFYDSGITSVTFPETLENIGNYAFYQCSGLTGGLNLSNCTSLTSIGLSAFEDCSGLTSLTLPSSLTSIGASAFRNCSGLTGGLNLGGCTSLTSIGASAFRGCSGLTSISLPSRLTSIGSSAFYDCDGLTSLTLPSSITSIGSMAFYSTKISVVNYNGTLLDWLKVSINTVGANSWIVTHRFIINGEELINLEVPEGVESINDGLFSHCSGLKSVTLPSTLKTIGRKAFYNCSGLTGGLNLGGCTRLTSIGDYAFRNCSGLTGGLDFSNCTSLTSIGGRAFYNCSGLTGGLNLGGCTRLTSIGSSAFFNCRGLTSISLPSSLTSIGSSAFEDCSGLTSISLPSSLTSIGSYAFRDCSALESVVFPEGSTGWYVTTSSTATSGDPVDVTNSNTNASNLTGQYVEYYWKRNV